MWYAAGYEMDEAEEKEDANEDGRDVPPAALLMVAGASSGAAAVHAQQDYRMSAASLASVTRL